MQPNTPNEKPVIALPPDPTGKVTGSLRPVKAK
jgi:hypothetical protein